jgi:hypothetical protein
MQKAVLQQGEAVGTRTRPRPHHFAKKSGIHFFRAVVKFPLVLKGSISAKSLLLHRHHLFCIATCRIHVRWYAYAYLTFHLNLRKRCITCHKSCCNSCTHMRLRAATRSQHAKTCLRAATRSQHPKRAFARMPLLHLNLTFIRIKPLEEGFHGIP